MKLWSLRKSVGNGWHWQLERECSMENRLQWLKVYREDEPGVEFRLQITKPRA